MVTLINGSLLHWNMFTGYSSLSNWRRFSSIGLLYLFFKKWVRNFVFSTCNLCSSLRDHVSHPYKWLVKLFYCISWPSAFYKISRSVTVFELNNKHLKWIILNLSWISFPLVRVVPRCLNFETLNWSLHSEKARRERCITIIEIGITSKVMKLTVKSIHINVYLMCFLFRIIALGFTFEYTIKKVQKCGQG